MIDAKELGVTYLASADCGDYLLIASDSQVIDDHGSKDSADWTTEEGTKLWRVGELQIVWGFSGVTSIGHELRRWLDWYDFSGCNRWEDFSAAVRAQLAALRTERTARGVESAAGAFFVGYVKNDPEILSIDDDTGEPEFLLSSKLAWSGSDSANRHSLIARELLQHLGRPIPYNEETMTAFMKAVVGATFLIEGPIQMWKVTTTSVEQIAL